MSISRDPMAMAGAYLQAVGMVEAGPEHREYGLDRLQELARMGHIKAGWRLADELVRDPPAKFNDAVAYWTLAAYRTGHAEALETHLGNLRNWRQSGLAEELERQRRDIDIERQAAAEKARAAAAEPPPSKPQPRPASPRPAAATTAPPQPAPVAEGAFVRFLADPGTVYVLSGLCVMLYVLIWFFYMR